MSFDPMVIEHLGVRMYSTLPPVLSELIANAYDADATNVQVELHDKGEKRIIVKDDGIGMSYDDIRSKFLVIGRNRRKDGDERTLGGRKPIGKKGLGKLSFFGIVKTITVDTVKDAKRNVFVIDWKMLMESGGKYPVDHRVPNESVEAEDGTTVELTNIKRKSDFSATDMARSISRFFIFDEGFNVTVSRNDKRCVLVTNQMRFDSLEQQFGWDIPDAFEGTAQYASLKENAVKGRIITYKSPISSGKLPRGIALFSRQKLVQEPSYFAKSTSSYFFSYLSGWLEVDFIDDLEEDVIATNRQSLNWAHPDLHDLEKVLGNCINHIQKEWREKRDKEKQAKIAKKIRPDWYAYMPAKMRNAAKDLVKNIANVSSVEEEDLTVVVDSLLKVIPYYPFYHWRHLHKSLQKPLLDLYKKREYLAAAQDGVQIYGDSVRKKSQLDKDGVALFRQVFAGNSKLLEILHPFVGKQIDDNIQQGQQSLSVGLVESFRNPTAHSTRGVSHKFFNENDFLDVLSLISFLLRRVDKAKKVTPAKKRPKSKKP